MWNWGHHFEILKYESKSEGFSSFLELPSLLQVVFIVPEFTCIKMFMVESTVGYALQARLPEELSVRPLAGRNPRQLLWFTWNNSIFPKVRISSDCDLLSIHNLIR